MRRFHWKIMGDWSFDPAFWPDPKAMVAECKSYGIEVMASVWPFTCEGSRSYEAVNSSGWLATDSAGHGLGAGFGGKNCRLIDPSNPEFSKFAWGLLQESYHQYGIKTFWLDNSEPWRPPTDALFGRPGAEGGSGWSWADAGALFDVHWPKLFHDGIASAGDTPGMLLPRAGWIGSWKYGASLWNGDIGSTLPILANSIKTMLSAQLSGFGWMTIDGGGYCGGDSQSPAYRETQLRWIQLTTTLPIMRQHGQRDHTIFSWYGTPQEQLLIELVELRAAMQLYLSTELAKLSSAGRPLNRPLNYDFPTDPMTWQLAEKGLGTQNQEPPEGGRPARLGDVLEVVPCGSAPAWTKEFLDSNNTSAGAPFMLTLESSGGGGGGLCVDSATLSTQCGWQRQCGAVLWNCTVAAIDGAATTSATAAQAAARSTAGGGCAVVAGSYATAAGKDGAAYAAVVAQSGCAINITAAYGGGSPVAWSPATGTVAGSTLSVTFGAGSPLQATFKVAGFKSITFSSGVEWVAEPCAAEAPPLPGLPTCSLAGSWWESEQDWNMTVSAVPLPPGAPAADRYYSVADAGVPHPGWTSASLRLSPVSPGSRLAKAGWGWQFVGSFHPGRQLTGLVDARCCVIQWDEGGVSPRWCNEKCATCEAPSIPPPLTAPAAHTWRHYPDNTLRNERDAGFVGSNGGASSGGQFCLSLNRDSPAPENSNCPRDAPVVAGDQASSARPKPAQTWLAHPNGTIESAASPGMCLGYRPSRTVVGLDQYMVGDSMMVAPMLVPGERERKVYFPKGATWTHYFTKQVYHGGTTATVPAPLENFPLFYRGASF
eukprot:SAG11_NODE_1151_length_5668_cov_6.748070_2_plen_824_part_00